MFSNDVEINIIVDNTKTKYNWIKHYNNNSTELEDKKFDDNNKTIQDVLIVLTVRSNN